MSIYEPPIRNSGFKGGKYLDRCRVARPGSLPESPTYYGPQDFYIGAVVDIFRKRFVITDADYYVLKYIEEHEHQFPGTSVFSVFISSQVITSPSLPVPRSHRLLFLVSIRHDSLIESQ